MAQRDIASWTDWWYTADFTLFQPTWFKTPPFLDAEGDYKARSPITYINNVKTPLMLVLGEDDTRTPPGAGGEQMFRALKFRKIPTVMVKFPNETHELSRSGQPWHRVERLEHIVGWFDHWLLGVAKPEYEVAPKDEVSVKPKQRRKSPRSRPTQERRVPKIPSSARRLSVSRPVPCFANAVSRCAFPVKRTRTTTTSSASSNSISLGRPKPPR